MKIKDFFNVWFLGSIVIFLGLIYGIYYHFNLNKGIINILCFMPPLFIAGGILTLQFTEIKKWNGGICPQTGEYWVKKDGWYDSNVVYHSLAQNGGEFEINLEYFKPDYDHEQALLLNANLPMINKINSF